jgi:hypothetical protein
VKCVTFSSFNIIFVVIESKWDYGYIRPERIVLG